MQKVVSLIGAGVWSSVMDDQMSPVHMLQSDDNVASFSVIHSVFC